MSFAARWWFSCGLLRSRTARALSSQYRSGLRLVHTPSATQSPNADIFRRAVKTQHKENQYRLADHDKYTYLKREVARRVAGRVQDIKREFTDVLDVGCGKGFVTQALLEQSVLTPSSSSPVSITLADSSQSAIREAEAALTGSTVWDDKHVSLNFVCHDEDDALAPHADLVFPEGQYDLVVASMSSHWVNKLPSLFAQVRKSLKPDGCFMVAMLGGESLQELRSALTLAGLERMGGVAALISPFAQQKDLGDVLASSGFALTTLDNDMITAKYPDMFTLAEHITKMGEGNAVGIRPAHVSPDLFLAAAAAYQELYQDEDGLIECSYHVLYGIGWKPDPSQPQPKERGSATHSFKEGEVA